MGMVAGILALAGMAKGMIDADNAAAETEELSEEQSRSLRSVAAFNAKNTAAQAAEERRRIHFNQDRAESEFIARAAASGLTLSGTPADYIDTSKKIHNEEMSWNINAAKITVENILREGAEKAELALKYGANLAESQRRAGQTSAIQIAGSAMGTYSRLYNPANSAQPIVTTAAPSSGVYNIGAGA